jgi:hypothetical protein
MYPHCSFVYKLSSMLIPKNLQKALSYPKWKEAMQEEMKTLHRNNICDLVKLPNGKKVVE